MIMQEKGIHLLYRCFLAFQIFECIYVSADTVKSSVFAAVVLLNGERPGEGGKLWRKRGREVCGSSYCQKNASNMRSF